jgi:V/A-type H+-transporting ATPase subunit I
MGVMEIIGLSANVLSYSRLMALGIAGIAFAGIANGMPASSSWVLMPLALLGAIGVHAFNIGLSVFSPTIHSVRLNFVEFLPKFYHPEGRNYEPFRKDMAW